MDERPRELFFDPSHIDYTEKIPEMVLSNIYELDRLVQGFTFDCVTIWTGVTNAGKTTMLTLIANEAIKQGETVFYFNGEQTPENFVNNLIKQQADSKDIYEVWREDAPIVRRFVRKEKATKIKDSYNNKLFIYNNMASRKIKDLLFAMEECRRLHGTRVFVLDNFMQIDLTTDDVYQGQSQIMEELRNYAVKHKVHIHLVAHPRKMAEFQTRLSLYDISGSMNLANKAYNVISIMRIDNMDPESLEYLKLEKQLLEHKFDIREAGAILEVLKTKGESCGLVPMIYDKLLKTYRGLPELSNEKWNKRKAEFFSQTKRK